VVVEIREGALVGRRSNAKSKSSTRRTQTATRNVGLQQAPYYQAIGTEQQNAQQDYLNQLQAGRAAYGGFQQQIAPYGGQYTNETNRIGQNLSSELQGLQGYLPTQPVLNGVQTAMPGSEQAAYGNFANAIGTAGFNTLASEAQRNLDYQTSARREGALANRYMQDTLAQQMSNQARGFSDRRLGLAANEPAMIQQESDRLRQQALENQMVRQQQQSDEAFNQLLASQIETLLNPPHRRNNAPPPKHRRNQRSPEQPSDYPSGYGGLARPGGYDYGTTSFTGDPTQQYDPYAQYQSGAGYMGQGVTPPGEQGQQPSEYELWLMQNDPLGYQSGKYLPYYGPSQGPVVPGGTYYG